ncbi:MAG: glutathione S-transferase C-terminal domain-containing protein [Lachnospiraceae bacterium]|nr:glutathione S-transferase C-terminal domain-containing protein [Lachnospiraceae bacterium]
MAVGSETEENGRRITGELKAAIETVKNAGSQAEYEDGYRLVFKSLDSLEDLLSKNRFLSGNTPGEADRELYEVITAFDTAYYFALHLNKKRIRDYENLWNYAKELYSIPEFKETADFDAIKRELLMGKDINPFGILPVGPDNSAWEEDNNRSSIFGEL